MKKFNINCFFNGQPSPFALFIGSPESGHHPFHFQAHWLSQAKGGEVPSDVMDAVTKLKNLSEKNSIPLEDLCVYALSAADPNTSVNEQEFSKE